MVEKVDRILKDLCFIVVVIFALTFAVNCFASDIEVNEPQPEITKWKLDSVRVLIFTKTCEVVYRKGYMDNGNFVSTNQGRQILFMDVADDPSTPEDETNTEFTQLINLINSENDIKASVTKAVKLKLGI